MRDFPVEVPAEADFRRVETAVEKCCREMGLIQAMKGTLAKYPGCVHWHYKKPRVSGTLEVTSWPLRRQLWITVHERRCAEWVEEELPIIRRCFEDALVRIVAESS
jgi:hypothetical protein